MFHIGISRRPAAEVDENFEKNLNASFYSSINKEFCEEDNPPD